MKVNRYLLGAIDPVQIMLDAGYKPDEWQAAFLRSEHYKHLLMNCRQSGKTTVCVFLALYVAIFDPGLILVVSPTQRQSDEVLRKAIEIINQLDPSVRPETTSDSVRKIEFSNGSRILALPGDAGNVRGFSAAKLIILDEASRISDELIAALAPMQATVEDARFVALSTPHGRRGWFFNTWENGQGWARTKITADKCPRISKAFLEQQRLALSPWEFEEEYMCMFHDSSESFFSSALIEAALTDEVKPLWRQ